MDSERAKQLGVGLVALALFAGLWFLPRMVRATVAPPPQPIQLGVGVSDLDETGRSVVSDPPAAPRGDGTDDAARPDHLGGDGSRADDATTTRGAGRSLDDVDDEDPAADDDGAEPDEDDGAAGSSGGSSAGSSGGGSANTGTAAAPAGGDGDRDDEDDGEDDGDDDD